MYHISITKLTNTCRYKNRRVLNNIPSIKPDKFSRRVWKQNNIPKRWHDNHTPSRISSQSPWPKISFPHQMFYPRRKANPSACTRWKKEGQIKVEETTWGGVGGAYVGSQIIPLPILLWIYHYIFITILLHYYDILLHHYDGHISQSLLLFWAIGCWRPAKTNNLHL